MELGFPPLVDSYADYVNSLLASFSSPSEVRELEQPSIKTAVPLLDVPTTSPGASPSAALPDFWRQHSSLYGFLLISLKSFPSVIKGAPSFPRSSVDDPMLFPGLHALNSSALQAYRPAEKKWVILHTFASTDATPTLVLPSASVYFRVI